ncbi:O-antigen ligase family protein [Ketobacter nezhaii]|uniref:O-antigen ligase family protein n=1 Tax=Ketobacter sp. MCCC 1A13808 TaxID=2602738 RepID=UPI0021081E0B|nr:O-antigen ligase family protein [Ketobacter sp. MCCC 1A13808]
MLVLRKTRYFRLLFVTCLVLSLIYQSRAGMLFLFFSLALKPNLKLNFNSIAYFLLFIFAFSILSFVLVKYGGGDTVLDRFVDIDYEVSNYEKGLGRLVLIDASIELLKLDLFGYGVGLGMEYAQRIYGDIQDANFHNIYLQISIESGIQALLVFLVIVSRIFTRCRSSNFNNGYANAALCYAITGLFQFNSYDPVGWLLIGLSLGNHRNMIRSFRPGISGNSKLSDNSVYS